MSLEQPALDAGQMRALVDLAEEHDGQVRSYSGRGMYGKTCLGVSIDGDLVGFALRLGAGLALVGGAEVAEWLAGMANVDSMGRGLVVYFPGIAAPANTEDEENEQRHERSQKRQS